MSQSASQAAAFYRDVAKNGSVWLLNDDEGQVPIARQDDHDVTPVWSTKSRLEKTVKHLGPGFQANEPTEMSWEDFRDDLLPTLEEEGVRIGVNWSGEKAVGYDIEVPDLIRNVEAAMEG
jgi:hypothetical protein